MAMFETSRSVVDGHLFGARPGKFFSGIFGAIAAWNDARITRNSLSSLSDHELDDLGLTRSDVDKISSNLIP